MKYSEMDMRQKKAFKNIKYAACDLIGGLENGMLDNPEDSSDYNDYKNALADHDYLVNEIYSMATTGIYDEGYAGFGPGAASYMKDIRFCGKNWLMERCEKRVTKMGY